MQTLMQTLGEQLHRERRRQGKTLRDVAESAKVSYSIISLLETGQRPQVSFQVVARLAKTLGVSLDGVLKEACLDDAEAERPQRRTRGQAAANGRRRTRDA